MTRYVGHDEAWRAWRGGMTSGRMHHGWILAGPEGLGKAGFARAAAAEWVSTPGVPQPAPESHPDILFVRPLPATDDDAKKQAEGRPYATKRNIAVDQIRQVQRRLVTRPTLGDRRAVIIDAGDELEKAAVNALLKSLEEPPHGTVFLLIVHRLGRMLPTVRSRCQVLRFAQLERNALERAVGNELGSLAPEARAALLDLSGGSPGKALGYVDMGLPRAISLLTAIVQNGDDALTLRGELVNALGMRPSRDAQAALIEVARRLLVTRMALTPVKQRLTLAEVHQDLVNLGFEMVTHNFDPTLLLSRIGGLLASVAPSRESAE